MPLEQTQLGIGRVWHQRLRPRAQGFVHRSYFLRLPLRSLRLDAGALVRNRAGLISFHDADHGAGGPDALAWFDALLAGEGITDADGEVWLHTFPRVLGYVFKPVSFWYAHRATAARRGAGRGEQHLRRAPRLPAGAERSRCWGATLEARKVFHVSPFCPVAGRYRFCFVEPGVVRITLHDAGGELLRTGVAGTLAPLTRRRAWAAFVGMPLMTLSVIGLHPLARAAAGRQGRAVVPQTFGADRFSHPMNTRTVFFSLLLRCRPRHAPSLAFRSSAWRTAVSKCACRTAPRCSSAERAAPHATLGVRIGAPSSAA